jgi:hypothetical protein
MTPELTTCQIESRCCFYRCRNRSDDTYTNVRRWGSPWRQTQTLWVLRSMFEFVDNPINRTLPGWRLYELNDNRLDP